MKDEPIAPEKRSFWLTLPGILSQVAAVITAITGFIVVFRHEGRSKDAAIPPPLASPTFTATPVPSERSARVYFDRETGLMWTIRDNDEKVSWWQANDYAHQLRLDGHADWRLPTIDELEDLYDRQIGAIRTPLKVHGLIWSSTQYETHAWFFNFGVGLRGSLPKDNSPDDTRALCVRRAEK